MPLAESVQGVDKAEIRLSSRPACSWKVNWSKEAGLSTTMIGASRRVAISSSP